MNTETPMMRADAEWQLLLDMKKDEVAKLRKALASVCVDILTSPAVTDTMWCHDSDLSTTADYIAQVLGFDTVAAYGGPSDALRAAAKVQP